MLDSIILSAGYLPPVSYFHAIQKHDLPVLVDQYEHFQKQTYRSRTRIGTANGFLDLFVPIQHGRKQRVAIKEVKISYDHEWQKLHWASIETAYRSSPYFEYYEDDFHQFYNRKYDFLFDYNIEQLELICKVLKIKKTIGLTSSFEKEYPNSVDLRDRIHPKKESVYEHPKPYYQLFEDRNGFIPELSIVDLIFNQGPQSKNYL